MIMKLRTSEDGGIFGDRDIADGVSLHFAKWGHDGHKNLYITHGKDVLVNIEERAITENKGVVSGVYKDGDYYDELAAINASALRFEVDGDSLILYYPMSRIIKTLKKAGVTYSRKISL